jgi:tRNA(Arg) A34 adenosine deaminase TadA
MGSLPIGAAITDGKGHILARGRNRFHEMDAEGPRLCGHRLAHAEMNALLALDWQAVDPRRCVLYTTTEPCPLCVGAIRMARMPELHFASRDGAAGSVDLFQGNAYMRRGNVKVHGPHDTTLEVALVGLLVEFGLTEGDESSLTWVEWLTTSVPAGAQLGSALFASGAARCWRAEGLPAEVVLDRLAALAFA